MSTEQNRGRLPLKSKTEKLENNRQMLEEI